MVANITPVLRLLYHNAQKIVTSLAPLSLLIVLCYFSKEVSTWNVHRFHKPFESHTHSGRSNHYYSVCHSREIKKHTTPTTKDWQNVPRSHIEVQGVLIHLWSQLMFLITCKKSLIKNQREYVDLRPTLLRTPSTSGHWGTGREEDMYGSLFLAGLH